MIPYTGGAVTHPLNALPVREDAISAGYGGSTDYEASEASIVQVVTP